MKLGDIIQPILKLLEDGAYAESLLKNNTHTQFARRAYVRSLSSQIEGIVWLLKQTCLKLTLSQGAKRISLEDYLIITEQAYDIKNNGDISLQTKFFKLPQNLRFTIKIINRLFGMQLDLQIETIKWQKKFFKIYRNS